MPGQSSIKLPVINFSNKELIPGSPEWDSTKGQVLEALVKFGFFEAVYEKVPLDLRSQLFGASKEVFHLPLETKLRKKSGKYPAHGYHEPRTPLYESITIEDAPILESAANFTNLMWPEGNVNFCKTMHSYAQQVAELDQLIKRMVLESLGVQNYVDELMKSTEYVLRFIKYEPHPLQTLAEGVMSPSPHTDKTTMSILCENEVHGLQVKTTDGQWMDVKLSPNSFAVFSGDIFMAWTNGGVYSTEHGVMVIGSETRYSVGLFSTPKAGYTVKAPRELVDEQHPLLFNPFDYAKLVEFCDAPEHWERWASKSSLAAYCGI